MPFRSIISDSDVIDAHTVPQRNLVGSFSDTPSGTGNVRFDKISITKNQNVYILDKDMTWEFYSNKQLINKPQTGKVAVLKDFRIKHRERKDSLGKDIYIKCYSILKKEEFKQIQLTAKWDGVVVWPTLYFQFDKPLEEGTFLEHVATYMLKVLGFSRTKTNKIIKSYKKFEDIKDFLKPDDEDKEWFSVWYRRNLNPISYDMHKDIT